MEIYWHDLEAGILYMYMSICIHSYIYICRERDTGEANALLRGIGNQDSALAVLGLGCGIARNT